MPSKTKYKLRSQVIPYPGFGGWHFLYVNEKVSSEIKERFKSKKRGFGSLRVTVTLGKTVWETSIFPDSHSRGYVLPLKASIRKKESVYARDMVDFTVDFNRE